MSPTAGRPPTGSVASPRPSASPYDTEVFINCPFDPWYLRTLFRPIVFAVRDCGFTPHCLLEKPGTDETRIGKIFRMIKKCRYGIHDISATELDSEFGLPRFNMPLELGLFMGARRYGSSRQKKKSCIVFDREPYRYQIFCSDIAGQDLQVHQNRRKEAIKCVRDWLATKRGLRSAPLVGGDEMHRRYVSFSRALRFICEEADRLPSQLTFQELLWAIDVWLKENPQ